MTTLQSLLGIDLPVVQDSALAIAVSNAGGPLAGSRTA